MKLSSLTIFLIGLSISLIILAAGLFGFFGAEGTGFLPNRAEIAMQKEYIQQLKDEANKMPQALRRVEKAKALVEEVGANWQQVVATNTPPPGMIDLDVPAWQLTKDARGFRNNVQRAVNAQVKVGGVTVISGPFVPFTSESATSIVANDFNYPALGFPVAIWDFGTVTVRGTFEQISANVSGWKDMPNFLAVADGLQITGTSPMLTATYNLSMVAFIRGNQIFPPVPEGAGGGGTAPGGGGMPGPGRAPGG
ncbi:MAG TPA: hypothetical protein PLH94_15080 [Fimbriimonadaceae bacterium]|mgnify:CR=1 FL=1|nr:hypothetical protein [Fimbriimonadaceae bacterium]